MFGRWGGDFSLPVQRLPLKAELTASGITHLQLPFRFVMKTETCVYYSHDWGNVLDP